MSLPFAAARLTLPLLALAACAEPTPAPVVATRVEAARQSPAQLVAAPAAPVRTLPRMPTTLNVPLGLHPAPGWSPTAEPAPIPNRAIEAPRDSMADSLNPTLEPMLLPPERRLGATFGSEHLRETGPDRPLDNVMPGARLRIPFESEVRR